MRTIDADELMEHVCRGGFDSNGLIAEMIKKAPTVETHAMRCRELEAHIAELEGWVAQMRGEIKALAFAVRVNGVSGDEVAYEKGEGVT